MTSKVYLSLFQFLFLALMTDAMPESFPRDTTDLPDDQKELKEVESLRNDIQGLHAPSPYQSNVFRFRSDSEELPDFSYHPEHLGKLDLDSDRVVDGQVDMLIKSGDLAKRGSRQFKQGGQKFRFDPALNSLGLGKRDNSDRPKYNPGWKFIGLGKRIMPVLQGLNPSAFKVDQMGNKNLQSGVSNVLLPYYHMLGTHDISMFLDDIKGGLQGTPRRSNRSQSRSPDDSQLGIYYPVANEDTSAKVKHSTSGFFAFGPENAYGEKSSKPQPFFTRSRKPTSMFRNKSKPMYDPGYLMTGLGK